MKTVGIIGGLGPETTAKFYLQIVSAISLQNSHKRPPVLMWSIPLPLEIEKDLIVKAEGEKRYLPFMIDAAKRLEKGGADFIVIPCNSVHIFIKQIRKSVSIPVFSIVEETIKFLKSKLINKVGILSTSTALRYKLYESLLLLNNISVVIPNQTQQSVIGSIIFDLVNNKFTQGDESKIEKIMENFKGKGVKTVILACTDLQLLDLKIDNLNIYDTMRILAEKTVQEILS